MSSKRLPALACKRCCNINRAQCHCGVNFLAELNIFELESNSQASLLQAPDYPSSMAGCPSRSGVFASLQALNVSLTAVGCACSIVLKRKPATSISLSDQT